MPKQYTFRTTKETIQIEKLLDSLDRDSRSAFIRNALLASIGEQEVVVKPSVTSHVTGVTTYVPRETCDVTQILNPNPNPLPRTKAPEPTFKEVREEVSLDDLEAKLNNVYGG